MLFVGIDERLSIKNEILLAIRRHVQNGPFRRESGGVLIGRELIEGNLVVVEHMTGPMPRDFRGRHFFDRRDASHVVFYNELNKDECIYAYIGEWHTHPERSPEPSAKDLRNWSRIRGEDFARSVQYHAIAGTYEIGFWAFGPADKQVSLVARRKWGDLGL